MVLEGLVDGRAKQRDLHEVVEVARLQRGVLPVVREAHELPGGLVHVALAPQIAHRGEGLEGGRRAAALAAQPGQLAKVVPVPPGIDDPAVETSQKGTRQEPARGSVGIRFCAYLPTGADGKAAGEELGEVRFGIGPVPGLAVVEPAVREILFVVFRPDRVLRVGIKQQVAVPHTVTFAVIARHRRAGNDSALELVPLRQVILLAALAAEDEGKEELLAARGIVLALERQEPVGFVLQGSVDGPSARDELVQLEDEEWVSFRAADGGALLEESAESVLAHGLRFPGIVRELPGSLAERDGRAAAQVSVLLDHPESVFNPGSQRVSHQVSIRGRREG